MIGSISLVGDGGIGFDAVDKIVREGNVVALSRRADQSDRQTEGLGCTDMIYASRW